MGKWKYEAFRPDGSTLQVGDVLTDSAGLRVTYQGTHHPRKVTVRSEGETDTFRNRDYYANVFDLGIRGTNEETGETAVTFAVTADDDADTTTNE